MYLYAGPAGQRPGSVTAYDPPWHITFHHAMLLKQGPLAADIGSARAGSRDSNNRLDEDRRTVCFIRSPPGECGETRAIKTLCRNTAVIGESARSLIHGLMDSNIPRPAVFDEYKSLVVDANRLLVLGEHANHRNVRAREINGLNGPPHLPCYAAPYAGQIGPSPN